MVNKHRVYKVDYRLYSLQEAAENLTQYSPPACHCMRIYHKFKIYYMPNDALGAGSIMEYPLLEVQRYTPDGKPIVRELDSFTIWRTTEPESLLASLDRATGPDKRYYGNEFELAVQSKEDHGYCYYCG